MTKSPKNKEDEPERSAFLNDSIISKPNLKGDWVNFYLLLVLYLMQGFPLGFGRAVPILLQSKKTATYKEQVSCNMTRSS